MPSAIEPQGRGDYSKRESPPASMSGYLPTLDGWRGVAILGVVICHGITSIFRQGGTYPNEKLSALLSLGAYGVQIFFGISGFLITCRLIEEHGARGAISLRSFYIRRATRILPASLLYLAVVFVLQKSGFFEVETKSWLASLLFFKNLVPDKTWYLSHFWSLSIEEQFYFFWPALLVTFGVRWGALVAGALFLANLCASNVYGFVRFDGLLAGCILAFVASDGVCRRDFGRLLGVKTWSVLFLLFLGGVVNKIPYSTWWHSSVIALLIAGTVLNSRGWAGAVLEWRPLRWVGRISYSLYLWQQLFCLYNFSARPFGILQEFPLSIVAALSLALLSFYFIEKPLIRLGHRLAPPISMGRGDINARAIQSTATASS